MGEFAAGHRVTEGLRSAQAWPGVITAPGEQDLARVLEVPVAVVHGAASYYADFAGRWGRRHIRVCTGTACFAASGGGGHVRDVENAVQVTVGGCSADGEVSLQGVHCLGYCYAGPAALDGETPCAGPDLAAQLAGQAPRKAPAVPVSVLSHPSLIDSAPPWTAWSQVRSSGGKYQVLREVAVAGLRGRGGAGFSTAKKWQAVAGFPGVRYVVANGDEGDPGSFSDRLLMERYPEKVLEGLALAGLACGAKEGFVYVRSEYPAAFVSMTSAVKRARDSGFLTPEVFEVMVIRGAGSYVAGEETSLLRSLAGRRATVTAKPPYPAQQGVAVNNVETLASVPTIVSGGGAAYARLGQAPETGTILVCLSEMFRRPGAYEVELGSVTVRQLVEDLGGGLRDGLRLAAVQIGGPLGGFLGLHQLDVPLLDSALTAAGAALGHGGIVAIDERVSPVALEHHLWEFAASESCGTCTPCREGTALGAADPAAAEKYLGLMEKASLCAFGRGVPRAVRSLRKALGQR
ncbi:NAD(P)H-dependent oxidoreductase subunit E [Catelliglobosispora koreensis]|uniref:NAD(P)H-dependent oxidoreductase subunit E n=1 Tax=Catelliglobosispora koreensis TaxID=129052 RepID=UPI00035EEFE5|nr:NAD(P)H-dependent oxidoreductase subunit E [Catelliglobosispora koreensis]